jgi:excisionase family DNA binding protein
MLVQSTNAAKALPTLIDMATAAEHLGVSLRHVRRLVAEKRIPYVKVGHLVRFDPGELAGWIDAHRIDTGAARRRA